MAILSVRKEWMDKIREDVSLAVVSIWEADGPDGSKLFGRSGFVIDHEDDRCVVLTLASDLYEKRIRKVFVRFLNGQTLQGSVTYSGDSNIAAIFVDGITFELKNVKFAEEDVKQGDVVFHVGCFDETNAKPHFSSGSVGLINHNNLKIDGGWFTRFAHSCSEKLHMLGAPVFNMESEFVGMNYSKKENKNIFFTFDLYQCKRELKKLFWDEYFEAALARLLSGENRPKAKRRKAIAQ